MFSRRMHRWTWMSVVLIWLGGASTLAQTTTPDRSETLTTEQSPPPFSASSEQDDVGALRPGRAPLLREGSLLVDVRGWMRFDEKLNAWIYLIDEDDESAPGYELTLLPGSILSEMIELKKIARGQAVSFEISGKALVYRGKSYLLPTHAPQLIKHDSPRDDDSASDPETPTTSSSENDSIQDIMKNLRDKVGPLPRTTSRPSSRSGRADGIDAPLSESSGLMLEGSMIVSRRGNLIRGYTGSWVFVFDSDASGLSDPPMTLLPCLLLESIESYAQRRGGIAPVIISGQVLAFNNQNYLYPSVYQIPRERTRLTP